MRFKRIVDTARNILKTRDFHTARLLAKQSVVLPQYEYTRVRRSITSPRLSVELNVEKFFRFLPDLAVIEELVEKAGAQITPEVDGSLTIEIVGVKAKVHGPEQIAILKELFLVGIYNVVLPRKTVVIDIGMNVGLASLFFASQPQVEAVYAFEPFPETYALGLKNLELNPALSNRIFPRCMALASDDGTSEVEYSSYWKNSNSTVNPVQSELRQDGVALQSITKVDAARIVREVATAHTDASILVKMDCEGSEYDIFSRWDESAVLNSIDVIMMEWHGAGPLKLEKSLRNAGYVSFSFHPRDHNVGMLYGVRC